VEIFNVVPSHMRSACDWHGAHRCEWDRLFDDANGNRWDDVYLREADSTGRRLRDHRWSRLAVDEPVSARGVPLDLLFRSTFWDGGMYAARLGVALAKSLAVNVASGLDGDPFEDLYAAGDTWFEADLYSTSGSNVTAFIDHMDVTHLWAVTGTIANPAVDAGLGNALSVTMNGTPYATSSRATTEWSYLHQAAMTFTHVHVKTSDAVNVLFATSDNPGGGNGIDTYVSAASTYTSRAQNVLGASAPVTTGWTNAAYALRIQHAPSAYVLARNGSTLSSGAYGGAVGVSNAAYPLQLGRTTSSFIGRWGASFAHRRSLAAPDLAVSVSYTHLTLPTM
jgi:hypothetical protein